MAKICKFFSFYSDFAILFAYALQYAAISKGCYNSRTVTPGHAYKKPVYGGFY